MSDNLVSSYVDIELCPMEGLQNLVGKSLSYKAQLVISCFHKNYHILVFPGPFCPVQSLHTSQNIFTTHSNTIQNQCNSRCAIQRRSSDLIARRGSSFVSTCVSSPPRRPPPPRAAATTIDRVSGHLLRMLEYL